jgi:hypothetical protein
MNSKLVCAALLMLSGAASAQSMNAQAFHNRATALQRKGMLALFSSGEIKALTAEGQAAGLNARKQRQADLSSGRAPRFCPPPGKIAMGDQEFMQRLGSIPAAERSRIDMTEAMNRILAVKFPCRA